MDRNAVWTDVNSLPIEYEPPPWKMLLLDAEHVLPQIGPAIVLAATALEVGISQILDDLASRSPIPVDLWHWITNRGFFLKEPSEEEQFDELLRILVGTSLKEDPSLWEGFKNIKDARNSFVHEGTATIGRNVVREEDARRLIGKAKEIFSFLRSKIPEDVQWPEYHHEINVNAVMPIVRPEVS